MKKHDENGTHTSTSTYTHRERERERKEELTQDQIDHSKNEHVYRVQTEAVDEQNEVSVVPSTDTIPDPWTMMIKTLCIHGPIRWGMAKPETRRRHVEQGRGETEQAIVIQTR